MLKLLAMCEPVLMEGKERTNGVARDDVAEVGEAGGPRERVADDEEGTLRVEGVVVLERDSG